MDNITNKATGLTKEMLNMTYPDKYYQNVINPAKTGTGPIPSKTQMMYQNLKSGGPFKAMRIGMDPYLPSFMGGGKYNAERAMPTGPAKAALGGFGTALRTAFSLPMTSGALAQQGLYSLNKPSTPAGFNYAQNLDRNSISSIADETAGLDYQQDYMQAVMDADKNYTGVTGAKMNLEEEFNPTLYSSQDDIDRRNIGVPQDSRFSGIMRNVARGPLFQGGAMAGNAIGSALGMANPLFALAGGIGSQFLNLGRSKPDMDYQYVNDPNNMGGLSVVDNKIQDPTGILQGKNFESFLGSKNLGEMYDKALGKNEGYLESLGGINQLTEEELAALGLTSKQMNRRNALLDKRGLITNRRQDLMYSGEMIPGTNMTRNQFADQYNQSQDNIGSNYDQLDSQSYTGSTASGGLGGGAQADGSYNDPYDPGTDD